MEAKQLLGLDVGTKRTGIARASAVAKLAEPLMSVETSKVAQSLRKFMKEYDLEAVVVGLPRNLSGDDTAQTTWVRDWVTKIKRQIDAVYYWQDEALTSHAAELKKISVKDSLDIDAMAAAIILQDFLDAPEAERVVC